MGGAPVNPYLDALAVQALAYLAVFVQSSPGGLRNWFGAQVDLLPVLMVYCGLSTGLGTLALTAVLGGLWFDALSSNPLGISVVPLFCVGFAIHQTRELILRDQPYARLILGMAASAAVPLLSVLLMWGGGYKPLISWSSLWQWAVLSISGGAITPPCFWLFSRLHAALAYSRPAETAFRPDREIKRGRD
jgi:rod shape-determining protein MreD